MSPDRLDLDRLAKHPWIAQIEYYATIGSTNDRAKECLAAGPGNLPRLIVAEEQTAGRGRGTNRWWTGCGSLAFSLLVDAQGLRIERIRSPLVALAAAVAIVEAVQPCLPSQPVGIRWPNDVYVGSRKLAGVLVEVPLPQYLVVGIGLNANNRLADAPAELAEAVATLWELTHVCHDRTEILLGILDHLAGLLKQLAATPEAVAARADALCRQHGETLTVETGKRSITGRCAGIAPDGALLLETPSGRQTVYSGVLCTP